MIVNYHLHIQNVFPFDPSLELEPLGVKFVLKSFKVLVKLVTLSHISLNLYCFIKLLLIVKFVVSKLIFVTKASLVEL